MSSIGPPHRRRQTQRRKGSSRDSEGDKVTSVSTPRLGSGGNAPFTIALRPGSSSAPLPRPNAPHTTRDTVEVDGKSVSFLRFSAATAASRDGVAPQASLTGGNDVELSDRVSPGVDGMSCLKTAAIELL